MSLGTQGSLHLGPTSCLLSLFSEPHSEQGLGMSPRVGRFGREGSYLLGGAWGHREVLCKGPPDSAGPAFQNREKYLLPFMSLQIMDFLLCLFTLLGSYVELPAYLKFVSRSRSRAVSIQLCLAGEVGGPPGLMGSPKAPSQLVTFIQQVPEPLQITLNSFICQMGLRPRLINMPQEH